MRSSCGPVSEPICRSDPTENDSIEGLRPNARGPGLVTFGVRVYFYGMCFRFFLSFLWHL